MNEAQNSTMEWNEDAFRCEHYASQSSGFTLIEMSIVLVIIGLIAGGVVVGRDLINAAYIRAEISQIEQFNTAKNTFYGKYQSLPGDMNYTTAQANGFVTTDSFGVYRGQFAPGDGDGNGLIQGCGASVRPYALGCGEEAFFWSDMSYANGMHLNLIPGTFGEPITGLSFASFDIIFGIAMDYIPSMWPAAKIGNGNFIYVYSTNGNNYYGLSIIPPVLPAFFGGAANTMGFTYTTPGISVLQAYNIDLKVDDGQPLSGRVTVNYVSYNGATVLFQANPAATGSYSAATCYNSTTSTYAVDSAVNGHGAGGVCALSFQFQ